MKECRDSPRGCQDSGSERTKFLGFSASWEAVFERPRT